MKNVGTISSLMITNQPYLTMGKPRWTVERDKSFPQLGFAEPAEMERF